VSKPKKINAPAAPTNLTASVSMSISLAWSLSSGATKYTVYRSTDGSRGAAIGSLTAPPYVDTTAVVGTSYAYGVTASNSAGESALSVQVQAEIPIPAPAPVPASADFIARSTGTGVFRAFAFPEVGPQDTGSSPNYGYQLDAGSLGGPPKLDASFSQIAGNALRFDVPSGSGSNPAGEWYINFSADLQTRFGAGQSFFVQWRQRFDKGMCNEMVYMDPPTNANPSAIKQVILSGQDIAGPTYAGSWPATRCDSHTLNNLIVTTYLMYRLPTMYRTTDHTAPSLQDYSVPGQYQWQNKVAGAPMCSWQETTSGGGATVAPAIPPACVGWVPDEFMTFQFCLDVGSVLGTVTEIGVTVPAWMNTRIRLWVAREGKPSILVHDLVFDMPVDADYGKLWLGPYMTSASPQSPHAPMTTWYGELIFSRDAIPDPVVGTLPIGWDSPVASPTPAPSPPIAPSPMTDSTLPPTVTTVTLNGSVWTLGAILAGTTRQQALRDGVYTNIDLDAYWSDGVHLWGNVTDGTTALPWYVWSDVQWAPNWTGDPRVAATPTPTPTPAPTPAPTPTPTPTPAPTPTPTPSPTPTSPLSSLLSGQVRALGQFTDGTVLTYARSEYGGLTADPKRNRILMLGGGGHTAGFTNDAGAFTGKVPFDVLYPSDTPAQLADQQAGVGYIPQSLVYAATNHIPANHTFLAGCVVGDKFYMMTDGGYAVAGGSHDMSVFDCMTNLWSPIPATRLWYYVATARADPVSGLILIIAPTPSFYSAFFVFDPFANVITQTTVPVPQFALGQTETPEMVYHPGMDKFICIGAAATSTVSGTFFPAEVHELTFNRADYNASTYTTVSTTGAGPTGTPAGTTPEPPTCMAYDPTTGLISGMVAGGKAFNYDAPNRVWATKQLLFGDGTAAAMNQAYSYLARDPVSGCILFMDPPNNVYAYRV